MNQQYWKAPIIKIRIPVKSSKLEAIASPTETIHLIFGLPLFPLSSSFANIVIFSILPIPSLLLHMEVLCSHLPLSIYCTVYLFPFVGFNSWTRSTLEIHFVGGTCSVSRHLTRHRNNPGMESCASWGWNTRPHWKEEGFLLMASYPVLTAVPHRKAGLSCISFLLKCSDKVSISF